MPRFQRSERDMYVFRRRYVAVVLALWMYQLRNPGLEVLN